MRAIFGWRMWQTKIGVKIGVRKIGCYRFPVNCCPVSACQNEGWTPGSTLGWNFTCSDSFKLVSVVGLIIFSLCYPLRTKSLSNLPLVWEAKPPTSLRTWAGSSLPPVIESYYQGQLFDGKRLTQVNWPCRLNWYRYNDMPVFGCSAKVGGWSSQV